MKRLSKWLADREMDSDQEDQMRDTEQQMLAMQVKQILAMPDICSTGDEESDLDEAIKKKNSRDKKSAQEEGQRFARL